MLRVRTVPSLGLILMGSMDWLTTIIGIFYFGAIEANPFIANIASTSLPAFTTVKLATTIVVGLLFYQAKKLLEKTQDKTSQAFKLTRAILRTAYVTVNALLLIAILNNVLVMTHLL